MVFRCVRYAPAPRPDFPGELSLELVSSTPSGGDGSRRNLSFVATGPDHMVLYFNDTVLDWPFLDHVPDASTSNGEHFVFFASAGDREAIEKRCELLNLRTYLRKLASV